MVDCSYKVTEMFSKPSKQSKSKECLSEALGKLLNLSLSKTLLPSMNKSVKDVIDNKKISRNAHCCAKLRISDILHNENCCVVAYPESDINEIYSIMTNLNLNTIPIVQNPWNKKLMGFVNKHQVEKEIRKVSIRKFITQTQNLSPLSLFLFCILLNLF